MIVDFIKRIFGDKKIIILDDIFPNILSGFRVAEYNYYLEKFNQCSIYTFVSKFDELYEQYIKCYPQFKEASINKIDIEDIEEKYTCSLFYTIFLNNAFKFLPIIEREKTPFVFTLYPGGGLWLDHPESDEKLRRVCGSPLLKKVIVTQQITYDYLLTKNMCSKDKIEFIYGGVVSDKYFNQKDIIKKYYKKNKNTFDICFVAAKYMDKGVDKGYGTFIEIAKQLQLLSSDIRFHVIGGFDANEIDVTAIENKISFYGYKGYDFLQEFYSQMDIILSPNIPFKLLPGSFDGFPTGCAVEAGLSGVAVFCTDELGMNIKFENNKDLCILPNDIDIFVRELTEYFNDLNKLYNLARSGEKRFKKVFNAKEQMKKRILILQKSMYN